ncbi:hypothetical protein ACQVTX_23290 [Bacillus pretiosus]|uniref:hypothetical protein n=1 Tax=Bacillus pretiosus TaxID=2983392 RepID=UPI003D65C3B5
MVEYDKVKVMVLAENVFQIDSYFKLFKLMMGENVTKAYKAMNNARIESDKFEIEFRILGRHSSRGFRAHYIINLVQDKELHYTCALPMTNIHSYLKDDPKWAELF